MSECRDLLEKVLPLTVEEQEFISSLNDRGDIAPELPASDPATQATIREHPARRWKALNVRQYRDGQEEVQGRRESVERLPVPLRLAAQIVPMVGRLFRKLESG